MLITMNIISNFNFNFNWTKALFYRSKINSHGVYVIKKKTMVILGYTIIDPGVSTEQGDDSKQGKTPVPNQPVDSVQVPGYIKNDALETSPYSGFLS